MRTFTDLTEIKLILLFILKHVGRPVTVNEVTDILFDQYDVNYFTLMQYLGELVEDRYVAKATGMEDTYQLLEKGEQTLSYFLFNLSASTKERLLSVIRKSYQPESHSYALADFTPEGERRFRADLSFVENQAPLFRLEVWTSSRKHADRICRSFQTQYERVYSDLMEHLLVGRNQFRAAIFDLDGTLVDSLEDLAASMNHALESLGYPGHPADSYRYFVGDGVAELARRALPEEVRGDEEAVQQCVFAHNQYYKTHWNVKTAPYRGMQALLEVLAYHGVKRCVLTNKPDEFAGEMVEYYFPNVYFDAVLGQKEGRSRKPAPDGILEIAQELNIPKEEILYIGDSNVDMVTAKNAGVFSAGALWGFRTEEELLDSGAGFIAKHPLDLLPFFER